MIILVGDELSRYPSSSRSSAESRAEQATGLPAIPQDLAAGRQSAIRATRTVSRLR